VVRGPDGSVAFRLWPPVAIGAPLLVGWLVTLVWGDPVDLGGWRVPLGRALALFFVVWNGWSLWLFGRHQTGLLPGQATRALIEEGPFRISRNPLYVGLLRSTWGWRYWHRRSGAWCCSQPRCCSSGGARSGRRRGSCTSGLA
jgi:protein-S-isoprenylcysteine O-methyltransferase Ste14